MASKAKEHKQVEPEKVSEPEPEATPAPQEPEITPTVAEGAVVVAQQQAEQQAAAAAALDGGGDPGDEHAAAVSAGEEGKGKGAEPPKPPRFLQVEVDYYFTTTKGSIVNAVDLVLSDEQIDELLAEGTFSDVTEEVLSKAAQAQAEREAVVLAQAEKESSTDVTNGTGSGGGEGGEGGK